MDVLIYLIPIALGLGLLGLVGFLWALKSGQFDDLDGEAARILFDDAPLHVHEERAAKQGGQSSDGDDGGKAA